MPYYNGHMTIHPSTQITRHYIICNTLCSLFTLTTSHCCNQNSASPAVPSSGDGEGEGAGG